MGSNPSRWDMPPKLRCALHGFALVRDGCQFDPVGAWISCDDTLAQKYGEVEDCVQSTEISLPWRQMAKEDLHHFISGQCRHEYAAMTREPSGYSSETIVPQMRTYTEARQKVLERVQLFRAMVHKVANIFPCRG